MQTKVFLQDDEIPRQWYNLAADLPHPLNPPLGPDGNPVSPDQLAPVFPMNLIEQEVSQERWIDIPEGISESGFKLKSRVFRLSNCSISFGNSASSFEEIFKESKFLSCSNS